MARQNISFDRLGEYNPLLREARKRAAGPQVWHCDYCAADYDERPEACGNCGNRNLRPPEAEQGAEEDLVSERADQLDIAFLRGLRQ